VYLLCCREVDPPWFKDGGWKGSDDVDDFAGFGVAVRKGWISAFGRDFV